MSNEKSRMHSLTSKPTSLGRLAVFADESGAASNERSKSKIDGGEKRDGSLASTLKPNIGGGIIDVVNKYKWTLSNAELTGEVPYVRLIEYKCNESIIGKQLNFYLNLATSGGTEQEILDVYKGVFSKENPTDFSYWFPYFSGTGFELRTQEWKSLDSVGDSLGAISEGATDLMASLGAEKFANGAQILSKVGGAVAGVGKLGIQATNSVVNVFDRPRVFIGHDNRSINISFPLYNTVNETDWQDNRDLIYLLMSQNLFNKRDYITGVSPVFYDVYIPGQYYCYAAAMTDIKVENLGNQRLLYGDMIVPDAYYVSLTLTEMVMPSKNQFEAITNGAAKKFVNSTTAAADAAADKARQGVGESLVRGLAENFIKMR